MRVRVRVRARARARVSQGAAVRTQAAEARAIVRTAGGGQLTPCRRDDRADPLGGATPAPACFKQAHEGVHLLVGAAARALPTAVLWADLVRVSGQGQWSGSVVRVRGQG